VARALVVGAGVVGLSCAVRLLEDGHQVDVVTREMPAKTTSAVAAALWYPYRAFPFEQVTAWSARSYAVFAELADVPGTGVAMRSGTELLREDEGDPWWASAVPSLGRTTDVRPPFVAGLVLDAPVIEMPVYLGWLQRRVEELGGTITRSELRSLPDGLVVNASGLGARDLVGDHTVRPVRGQVVLVSQVGLDRWWLDGADPTYVVPRSADIVVGGTDTADDWDEEPSDATARVILDRATRLVPELADATVLAHRVGLRPARPTVRLEREGDVVHCYGHGGAGVTLSWGCAEDVVRLCSPRADDDR
jgi:D-amino-acid oxidase